MVSTAVVAYMLCLGSSIDSSTWEAEDTVQPSAAETPTGIRTDSLAEVHRALWCEAQGLTADRIKHLARAVLVDPNNSLARGLLGFIVDDRGRWRTAESIVARERDNAVRAEYGRRRDSTAPTADSYWKLALWCEENGLKPEARANLIAVTRIAPDHKGAWNRLGCRKFNDRWLTEAQIAAERSEADALASGSRHWKPLLMRWRSQVGDKSGRDEAERALAEVTDPYAVPAVWVVFGNGDAVDQSWAVQILGQIDAPTATRLLTVLAASGATSGVRRAACETIARRDPREAVTLLVGLLRDPEPNPNTVFYSYHWIPVGTLGVGSPGITLIEDRNQRAFRFYTVDESFHWNLDAPRPVPPAAGYDERVWSQNQTQRRELELAVRALIVETLLDVGPVVDALRRGNSRVIQTLVNITGVNREMNWEGWVKWWIEERGYSYDPEQHRNPPELTYFQPKPVSVSLLHYSCFGAGTPVRTLTGWKPIESVRVGDQVLSQETRTGALSFEPVVAIAHNPPAATLRIELDDEPIVVTEIHRFWKAGKGWVMARDLRPGDMLRTIGGTARIASIARLVECPVYNLEVAEGQSLFVGAVSVLVHDNSEVRPVVTPFDAVPAPATADGAILASAPK